MATLTFSQSLGDTQRRQRLAGRTSQPSQYYDQPSGRSVVRQQRLGMVPEEPPAESPDFAGMLASYQDSMNSMWDEFMRGIEERNASLFAPKPYDPSNPFQNLSPPGQVPTMGGDLTVYKPEIWPGSYNYNPRTNAYDPLYNTENFFNPDPGRTVFDPASGKYVPMTGALRWDLAQGYSQWDDTQKNFQPVPSQIFGGTGVPTPPKGPFKIPLDLGGTEPYFYDEPLPPTPKPIDLGYGGSA